MATVTGSSKTVRNARKLERPRPLRTASDSGIKTHVPQTFDFSALTSSSMDSILMDLDKLHITISNGNFDDSTTFLLVQVCNQLKGRGQQLDLLYKEQLDRYFVTLRNASRDERLDSHCRLRLLEIIELRAMKWKTNENLTNYYKQKLLDMESPGYTSTLSQSATVPYIIPGIISQSSSQTTLFSLNQGEVLRSSGKFSKPTKIPGKNFFKDEIIIRNADSGKVMGIKGRRVHMIEELSDTIISFQRVSPGARDRLVQITGPNDESISQAKVLIDDTIRRNASPVREKAEMTTFGIMGSESSTSLNSSVSEESGGPQTVSSVAKKVLVHSYSMGDASLGEYTYSVAVGSDLIRISGAKVELVQTAKLVLEEYFAGQAELTDRHRPLRTSNSFTKPEQGVLMQAHAKFDAVPEKVNSWLTVSSSSSSSLGKRNGPTRSSSSEEETYKGNGNSSPTEDLRILPTKAIEMAPYSPPINSPLLKKATLFFQPNQGNQPESTKPKILYTRNFLLDCALLPQSQARPSNSTVLSLEAADLYKESPKAFDPALYREHYKACLEKRAAFRQSPPQSQEN